MRKQIFTLFLPVLLIAVITSCSSTQGQSDTDIPAQETAAAMVGAPTLESMEPSLSPTEPSDLAGQESTATTVEPSVMPTEPSDLAIEEPSLAPTEPSDLMTEEPATTEAMTIPAEATEAPQAAVATEPEEEVLAPTGSVDVNRLSNLLDFEIWNHNNEQIGQIDALVINHDTSQIAYVVVGVGGFLGLGEKEVPIPWQAFQLNVSPLGTETDSSTADSTQMTETPPNVFILDADKDRLDQAPDIDLNTIYEPEVDIDNQADDQTQEAESTSFYERESEVNSFWQSNLSQTTADEINDAAQNAEQMDDSTTDTAMKTRLILADDLLGATLIGQDGQADVISEPDNNTSDTDMADQPADTTQLPADNTQMAQTQDLGEVQEALVDTNTGKITYLLVSLNDIITLPDTQNPGLAITSEPSTTDMPVAADQLIFVPLQAVNWDAENEVLVYTGSQSLDQAPAINEEEFQSGVTPAVTTDADSFWGVDMPDTTPGTGE